MIPFPPARVLVVAELSANHLGSLANALELVDAAAAAGAHAVKLQTWCPGKMVLDRGYVLERGLWAGRNLAELYDEAQTPLEWHGPLLARAKARGIAAFTSVFDMESLAFLEAEHPMPAYKVASFELVDLLLIRAIARTGKPMILSTGMATLVEIAEAVDAAARAGCRDLTLLRCTSAYPAGPEHANLRTMAHMAERFDCRVGLSDHTPGIGVAVAAAALGAKMIEKHLKLDAGGGLDDAFSIDPKGLAQLVRAVQDAAQAPGKTGAYGPTIGEAPQLELRRSLYLARAVRAGDTLTLEHIRTARPALGLPPRMIGRFLGKTAIVDAPAASPVTWGLIEPADAIAEANSSRL